MPWTLWTYSEVCSVSALKGFNPKSATFRQHYYPEGGWGWVICLCAVLVQVSCGWWRTGHVTRCSPLIGHQVLTTGIQLSFGVLYIHILRSREFGLDTKEDFMSAGELFCLCTDTMVIRLIASLICNLDKYKSTPCSILPLFPSPEDISWK